MVFLTAYTASQLGFYAKYHSHPVNIAIHMVFVPLIYATAVILLGLTPSISLSSTLPPLNFADIIVAIYAIGYILLEPVAGLLILPFHLGVAYYAHTLPTIYDRGDIAKVAAGANIASWVAQFAGHGLAEGRAPALFENLFQSLYLAPLFVWLELLFKVGYRPALKKDIDTQVEQDKIARSVKKTT